MTKNTTVKLFSALALITITPLTLSAFAWGAGTSTVHFLVLYPALLMTTILLIFNVPIAVYFLIVISLTYAMLLNRNIGSFVVFERRNNVLYLVLALPYLTALALLPMVVSYLTDNKPYRKALLPLAFLIATSFPIYSIAERYQMDYPDTLFIDARIIAQNQVELNIKPGFGDSRVFVVTSKSPTLIAAIKENGEFYQGSYFVHDASFKKRFRFSNLKSITLSKVNSKHISPEIIWTTKELRGDYSFLIP